MERQIQLPGPGARVAPGASYTRARINTAGPRIIVRTPTSCCDERTTGALAPIPIALIRTRDIDRDIEPLAFPEPANRRFKRAIPTDWLNLPPSPCRHRGRNICELIFRYLLLALSSLR